jgi:hypothetical protein
MRPFGERDWNDLPHVAIMSPAEWDPSIFDANVPPTWYSAQPSGLTPLHTSLLAPNGELKDDLEGSDEESDTDRHHQSTRDASMSAYQTCIIIDELEDTDGYVLMVSTHHHNQLKPGQDSGESNGEIYQAPHQLHVLQISPRTNQG